MLANVIPLDIPAGNSLRFTVEDYTQELGDTRPPYNNAIIQVDILRVFLRNSSPFIPHKYIDIPSVRLQRRILPWLREGNYAGKVFTITKHGDGPDADWQLSVENG